MENNKTQIHKGHRQRLKDKVRKAGLNYLSEHEILELLLTYTIPQKDTNPLAHSLIDSYSSLSDCIDADYYDLMKIKGIGEETALFFKILSSLIDIYKDNKQSNKDVFVRNTKDAVIYFRKHFNIKPKEFMAIICISKLGRIVNRIMFDGYDDTEVKFNTKLMAEKLTISKTNSIFIFHTHPKGSPTPSAADIEATIRIQTLCEALGISVSDHIIFTEENHFSFRNADLLVRLHRQNHIDAKLLSIEYENSLKHIEEN